MSARPQPKCVVHCSSSGSAGLAPGSARPAPSVLPFEHAFCCLLEQLARLVRAQRDAVVEPGADHQPGGARGLAGVDRAGRALHRDRALAAVLRRVGAAEERADGEVRAEALRLAGDAAEFLGFEPLALFLAEPFGVGHGALDQHRVRVVGRVVVVGGVQVVAGEGLHDAVFVGVAARRLRRRPSGRGCRWRPPAPSRRCRSRRRCRARSRWRRRRTCPRSAPA